MEQSGKVITLSAVPKSKETEGNVDQEIQATEARREQLLEKMRNQSFSKQMTETIQKLSDPTNYRNLFDVANGRKKDK